MSERKQSSYTAPVLVVLVAIAAFLAGSFFTKIQYEKKEKVLPTPVPSQLPQEQPTVLGQAVGRFSITENEICLEEGKPLVYFFGSETCPYCSWEHPIFERVAAKFSDLILVRDNMDKPEAEMEVWQEYGQFHQGSIPFMILGCRYIQLGSGDREEGEAQEEENITAVLCKLTNGEPSKVCDQVKSLTEQIKI